MIEKEKKSSLKVMMASKKFHHLRLPENYADIVEYMDLGAYLRFDPNNPCYITEIDLLRLNMNNDLNVG